MRHELESRYPVISSSPAVKLLTVGAVKSRAYEVGTSYSRYLGTSYLAEPIAVFFLQVATLDSLDAAVLAIQDDEVVGPNLAAYAIADLSPTVLPRECYSRLISQFGDAVSELDHAVFKGARPIGTSSELVNCHGIDMNIILHELETGTLRSLCGIPFPAASHVAILSRVRDHA